MAASIYLDYQATTPCDPRVVQAMEPFWRQCFGNLASQHDYGYQTQLAVEKARSIIAQVLGATHRHEIIFTSGATESNNLALKGVAESLEPESIHLVTSPTEHSCVLATCEYLRSKGHHIHMLDVDQTGLINLQQLEDTLRIIRKKNSADTTILISLMAANNEIGTIHNLVTVGRLATQYHAVFHVDAAQAVGKIPLDVEQTQIDLLSISGHKIYGPKGIGALYISCHGRESKGFSLKPQIHGGGQEAGYRSGTLAVPLVVGLGKALEIAKQDGQKEYRFCKQLRDQLFKLIAEKCVVRLNGHPTQRLAHNLNLCFEGIDAPVFKACLQGRVAVSSGSACASQKGVYSHVLAAIGCSQDEQARSLRMGVGRMSTQQDIEQGAAFIIEAYKKATLRSNQPSQNPRKESSSIIELEVQ